MSGNLKFMLQGKLPLHLLQQLYFLLYKIVIVDHFLAFGAYEVVMMTWLHRVLDELVAAASIPEMQPRDDPHAFQQVKGAVHRCEANLGACLVNLKIDFLCRDVFPCSGQKVENCLPRLCDAELLFAKSCVDFNRLLTIHALLLKMATINNGNSRAKER
jgi:hypothetical protein